MDEKRTNILIYLILIIVLLAPRLPGVDSFVTLDEPSWLSQGANFYYALGQREFEKTVYEYQPAVTTMWIIATAVHLYFPEFRGFGQGYLDYEKGRLDPFMYSKGYDPLVLLEYARLIQIFILLFLFLFLYYLLQKLIPKWVAAFAIIFASFDPFFLGHNRMLDHESMVALFVVVSVLSLTVYLIQDKKFIFLVISGISAGLAQLTKSSAIAILAPVGILLLIQFIQNREDGWLKSFWNQTKVFLIWFAFLVLAYFIFWPGMWVAPEKMLYEVYGNAFSYAFQGARLKVTEELDVSSFNLESNFYGVRQVFYVLLYRLTPLTWLGVIFGLIFRFIARGELIRVFKLLTTLLLFTAVGFILLIGIAQGRNSPHYILTSYLALNLVAGFGWFYFLNWFIEKIKLTKWRVAPIALILIIQIWSALSYFPYYYTYRNPILYSMGWYNEYPQFPYCEGLEKAAAYLAQLPGAEEATAFVYYPRGCFSYFFPGETTAFRPYYIDGNHAEDLLNYLTSADYLVVYYANQIQLPKYHPFLDIISVQQPIYEVWMNDYKYVQVYEVDSFPPEIFEALADL
ncbi:MAG: glycosyltransferase family 39 protein [Anaerolineales bacterium]|nr:glycosyltransferase family 39 protein [Anaerolineales bacterium]